jgi:hypothetical protein
VRQAAVPPARPQVSPKRLVSPAREQMLECRTRARPPDVQAMDGPPGRVWPGDAQSVDVLSVDVRPARAPPVDVWPPGLWL